jgi:hypothetical protein
MRSKPAKKTIQHTTFRAEEAKSEYGTTEPQIVVTCPSGDHYRAIMASLHRVAAMVEEATPSAARWLVRVEATDFGGIVLLELADGYAPEICVGMAVLRSVVAKAAAEAIRFCEFEDCDQDPTEERGPMTYCATHAAEHDALDTD